MTHAILAAFLFMATVTTLPPQATQCATGDATALARTIYTEARGESVAGQTAVANVIRNRVESPVTWWGTDYASVIAMPYQFATGDTTTEAMCEIAEGVMAGDIADNVDGATHFHAASVSPDWPGLVVVAEIGEHLFYRRGTR